ncbi:non-ribosomal peptide synthetase [Burkholderia pseudomallei]|uniref:non-ribosomal peptide synthetase n=1 Tax=Burkholderia pseudomallei TaxID=28450 RepID=UPI0005F2DD69|nr:non-ribosomal peptide synthetase [Burkholderia pseudomallei]KJR92254.1 peptide synthetase [Burkholderia pseudomallei]MBD2958494.1 AMP-binding protein [Burkholderia pseudomallei]MBD2976310.1 AMP-binding protein [Burkholderia pseudomallei]MBF3429642.1 non-ribosomal peptide synthetase [Burkholderia pseudomallei]MBF3722903.1 non-ribosomal peptide synthetase [Burkholderia pseudomallei]
MTASTLDLPRDCEHALRAASPPNIVDLLLRAARLHPHTGVRFIAAESEHKGAFVTYPELLDEARRILGGLRARGYRSGMKVALLLEHASDFIPAFWACALGGFVPCPLVPIRNDPERWAKHLAHVDTLLDHPLLVTTEALNNDLPGGASAVNLNALRASLPDASTHVAQPSDPAVFVLTSGSTGNSKAVVLTHGNLLASMAGKNDRQQLAGADVTLNWISFDHVAALLEAHLLPLYVGAVQLHVEAAAVLTDPLRFLRLVSRYRVTMTFSPNFLFGQLNAALEAMGDEALAAWRGAVDLSSLRHVVSGGEAIVVATGQRFLDLLAPCGLARDALWPAFGMTETCAGSVYSREFPEGDAGREFASLGLPVAGLQMRIADDRNNVLPEGEAGEFQVRGPMIFLRYHNNAEATRAAFTSDGWFRTGDLGRIERGRLWLVGRSKDSIIVNGVNYFSHELETTLEALDGVKPSFVAAFPTRGAGDESEQLVVTFTPSFPLDDEDALYRLVIAIRNSTILLWGFRPALILPLPEDEFPKTSLGKTQRAIMRKRLEAGSYDGYKARVADLANRQMGGYVAPDGQTEAAVAAIFARMFQVAPEAISATASFFDLGGTSLDILKLKRHVEQRLGVIDLPIVTILQNPSVRALAARLAPGERVTAGEYDPVVPLQLTGGKTPLFCVHPGVGEVLVFVNLAKYFVNERPFYALRARGFNEGETYFSSFDEMVNTYVDAIRKRQPHGPYAVAGYSYGGAVAFEIAKVLEAQGERVDFVGSFNLPPHIKYRMDELDEVEGAVNLAFFLSLIDKQQSLTLPPQLRAAMPEQDPLAYLIDHAPPGRLVELDLDLAKFRAWAGLAQSLLTLGRSYAPSGSVRAMSIFYAIPLRGTKDDWLNKELRRWDEFTRAPNRYIDVAGEHYTLMGPAHVATFQAVLRAELDRALGGK